MSWPGSDERIHSVTTHTPNKKPRKTEKKELPLQFSREPHAEATYLGKRVQEQQKQTDALRDGILELSFHSLRHRAAFAA